MPPKCRVTTKGKKRKNGRSTFMKSPSAYLFKSCQQFPQAEVQTNHRPVALEVYIFPANFLQTTAFDFHTPYLFWLYFKTFCKILYKPCPWAMVHEQQQLALGHVSHPSEGPFFHGLWNSQEIDLLLQFLGAVFHEAGMLSFFSGKPRIPFCSPH